MVCTSSAHLLRSMLNAKNACVIVAGGHSEPADAVIAGAGLVAPPGIWEAGRTSIHQLHVHCLLAAPRQTEMEEPARQGLGMARMHRCAVSASSQHEDLSPAKRSLAEPLCGLKHFLVLEWPQCRTHWK